MQSFPKNEIDMQDMQEAALYLTEAEKLQAYSFLPQSTANVEQDAAMFIEELKIILASQVITLSFFKQIEYKLKFNKSFNRREIKALQGHILSSLKTRDFLIKMVKSHYHFITDFEYDLPLRIKGVMIMLASTLAILDNYALVQKTFLRNNRLRRILDESNFSLIDKTGEFFESMLVLDDFNMVFRKIHAIRFIKRRGGIIKKYSKVDPQILKISTYIYQSKNYQLYISEERPGDFADFFKYFSESLWRLKLLIQDKFHQSVRKITFVFSKIFGDTIGSFSSRKGLLYNKKNVADKIKKSLRPLDILLDKTPFRLTDAFIPGYWGHVAIWIGEEKDLKHLKLWNHPLVKKYQQQIINHQGIVEALRLGVTVNSIEHFMDVDDFAIIRHKKLSVSETRTAILTALGQIGKGYDYNFDIETHATLVCSELIYVAYENIDWNTHFDWGRFDIIPDDIAMQAKDDGLFKVVLLYRQGKEIMADKVDAIFSSLFNF